MTGIPRPRTPGDDQSASWTPVGFSSLDRSPWARALTRGAICVAGIAGYVVLASGGRIWPAIGSLAAGLILSGVAA